MTTTELSPEARVWSAAELRRLPTDRRAAALTEAAERAAADYHYDPALTAFESFGSEDLHGDCTDAGPR